MKIRLLALFAVARSRAAPFFPLDVKNGEKIRFNCKVISAIDDVVSADAFEFIKNFSGGG